MSDINRNIPTTWRWARGERHETDSSAYLDKRHKQHHVSSNLRFYLHSPKAHYRCFRKRHGHVLYLRCLDNPPACLRRSPRARLHVVGMLRFMILAYTNRACPLCLLMSFSVFMALSPVFHSINFLDHFPLSHSVLPVVFLPYWSFQLYDISTKVSLSTDIILCVRLGSKHQLTN